MRLPFNVETVVIARDGDDPVTKRDADQALHRGIARYLGQKLAVRITATPIGSDPNDILRSAGAEGLKALIEKAQFKLGRFDPTAFREELYRLNDVAWGWARKGASTLLDVPLDVLEKDRTAIRQSWAEEDAGTVDPTEVDEDQMPWPEPVTDIGPVLDTVLDAVGEARRRVTGLISRRWSCGRPRPPHSSGQVRAYKGAPPSHPEPRQGQRQDDLHSNASNAWCRTVSWRARSRPLPSSAPSTAMNPTLLLDEADNVITKNSNPELLAILNSGHNKKGAFVHPQRADRGRRMGNAQVLDIRADRLRRHQGAAGDAAGPLASSSSSSAPCAASRRSTCAMAQPGPDRVPAQDRALDAGPHRDPRAGAAAQNYTTASATIGGPCSPSPKLAGGQWPDLILQSGA